MAVAGNIGVGKSTLVESICVRMDWEPFYEPVTENPYLADFYTNMDAWSFHSQVFFLAHRLRSHYNLAQHPTSVVQDRSVYEDAEIFARNLFQQGHMNSRDYDAYRSLYQAVSSFLPAPDLLIYLEADVNTLMNHIRKRGRDFERNISPDYLERLNHLYNDWIEDWTACRILRIPMQGRDFQNNPADFAYIVREVKNALAQPSI